MAAGYSNTSQARKLGIKPGWVVSLDQPPPGWRLDDNQPADPVSGSKDPVEFILAFFREPGELPLRLPNLADRIYPAGVLWVAWPRRAAGHYSDITDTGIREHALPLGIVDVKVAAIDNDWSGQRYVWRMANRTGH